MSKRTDLALEQTDRLLKTHEGIEKDIEKIGEIEIVKVKNKKQKSSRYVKKANRRICYTSKSEHFRATKCWNFRKHFNKRTRKIC